MTAVGFVVLAVVVVAIVGYTLAEPGPLPIIVLAQRYGLWPFFFAFAAVALAVAVVWLRPAPIVWLVAASQVAALFVLRGWTLATIRRAARRCVIRMRWPSAARSAGLATTGDRRSSEWPGGAIVSLNVNRVEWLARINRGRALPDRRGVVYRLHPARGGRLSDIEDRAENIAAALNVRRVLVERINPSRGRLIVLWADPMEGVHQAQEAAA